MGEAQTEAGKFMQGRRPQQKKPLGVGRNTKLTPEVSKKICDALRAGNALSVAAQYAGVGQHTLYNWLARGRGERPEQKRDAQLYRTFVHDVEEAQAAAEVAAVLHWRSAMPKDWHAAERWLQATQPERWDPKRETSTQVGAFAGLNVNINTAQGPSTTPQGITVADTPLERLIEDNPALLRATMHLFDEIDAIYGNNAPPEADTSTEGQVRALPPTFEPQTSEEAVFDAEEGTWKVIDAESDPSVTFEPE